MVVKEDVPPDIRAFHDAFVEFVRTLPPHKHRISMSLRKLSKFSDDHLMELSTDIYDELRRRQDSSTRPNEHLMHRSDIHPKRNDARFQLGDLSPERFGDMCKDLIGEHQRRYPALLMTLGGVGEEVEPANESVDGAHDGSLNDSRPISDAPMITTTVPRSNTLDSQKKDAGTFSIPQIVTDRPDSSAGSDISAVHPPSSQTKTLFSTQVKPTKAQMVMESDNEEGEGPLPNHTRDPSGDGEPLSDAEYEDFDGSTAEVALRRPLVPRNQTDTFHFNDSDGAETTTVSDTGSKKIPGLEGQELSHGMGSPIKSKELDLSASKPHRAKIAYPVSPSKSLDGYDGNGSVVSATTGTDNKDEQIHELVAECTRMDNTISSLESQVKQLEIAKDEAVSESSRLQKALAEVEEAKEKAIKVHHIANREHSETLDMHKQKSAALQEIIEKQEEEIQAARSVALAKNPGHTDDTKSRSLGDPVALNDSVPRSQHEDLVARHTELKMQLEQQQEITERVRKEAYMFLEDMRSQMKSASTDSDVVAGLEDQIQSLTVEVQEWRSRYSKAMDDVRRYKSSARSSMLITENIIPKEGSVFSPAGLIKEVSVQRFQAAIDELLSNARKSDEELLEYLHDVVLASRAIIQEIDGHESRFLSDTRLISRTANQLISVVRNFAVSGGLLPLTLVDAASSDLAFAVVELVKAAGIRREREFTHYRDPSIDTAEATKASSPGKPAIDTGNAGEPMALQFSPPRRSPPSRGNVSGGSPRSKARHERSRSGTAPFELGLPIASDAPTTTSNGQRDSKRWSQHLTEVKADHKHTFSSSTIDSPELEKTSHFGEKSLDTPLVLSPPSSGGKLIDRGTPEIPAVSANRTSHSSMSGAESRRLSRSVQEKPDIKSDRKIPRQPHAMPEIAADSTISELQGYLEEQTSETVDGIQSLLSGIRDNISVGQLKPLARDISLNVNKMIEATGSSMEQTKNWLLRDKGTFILQNLSDCSQRMDVLYEELTKVSDDKTPPRQLKQRLAGVSFDMAKSTKELVKTVEEVSLKSELDHINSALER